VVCAGLVLIIAGLQLSACSESSTKAASKAEPSDVEPIKGTSLKRVTLSALSAKRLGVRTAPVRVERIAGGKRQRKVIPYAAVLYDEHGGTFTYTSPKPLAFVRQRITVDRIKDGQAVLSHGPRTGTAVVTVGAQELHGIEYEVEED
jgi:hypothetical protein